MKVSELISKLQDMQSVCGDVNVKVFSNDYVCDLHKIVDVTDGYYDGWSEHNGVIGIEISK